MGGERPERDGLRRDGLRREGRRRDGPRRHQPRRDDQRREGPPLPPGGPTLLRLLAPPEFREEITGDLRERYAAKSLTEGRRRAGVWFWGQIARMRPMALRRAARHMRALRSGYTPDEGVGMMGTTMSGWWHDVRQSARGLRTRTGFSVTVIATVALAVGATTSVFSVVNGVLLRPLDYPEPDRLVVAWQTRPDWMDHPNPQLRAFGNRFPLSVPTFNDWYDARTGLEPLGIHTGREWSYQGPEGADVVGGLLVTSGVFEALAVEPALGRYLTREDDAVGAPAVVVLSHAVWRDRFGSDPDVLDRTMSLDGVSHQVIGVMPAGFSVPATGGTIWASLSEDAKRDERDSQSYTVIARLRPGATPETALADLEAVQARLGEVYPDEQGDMGARVIPMLDAVVGDVRSTLMFLLAAVGLVLLIACVNIANMLSVNGIARRRELAVRSALGASRGRLVRGLLTESAVLAGVGGLGGIVLTVLTLPVMTRVLPSSLPRTDAVAIDARVLAFGLAVTALTALVVGMLPALQAGNTQPKQMMDASARGLAGGRLGERLRSGLVATEVALAFVLLVGATLLATSFTKLWNVDRGFATEGLVAMSVWPNPVDFPEHEHQTRFREELQRRLDEIPGVRAASTNQVPLSGSSSSTTYVVDRPDGSQEETTVMISVISETYIDVAGIALVEGRAFEPADFGEGELVALANRALVERLWPGEPGVGQMLRDDADDPPVRIVGVLANVRHQRLDEPAEPKLYLPDEQSERSTFYWLLRTQGDPKAILDLAREAVDDVSSSTPVRSLDILDERIASSVAVPRFRTLFVVGLAGIATVLALLGVYGVVTFAVSQRTRELAVRMAIGAHPRDVVAGTLARGMRLSLGGVVVGLLIVPQIGRVLDEFLFEVDPLDPVVFALVAVLVGGVSALASYLPARRASRVDPVSVLNTE